MKLPKGILGEISGVIIYGTLGKILNNNSRDISGGIPGKNPDRTLGKTTGGTAEGIQLPEKSQIKLLEKFLVHLLDDS